MASSKSSKTNRKNVDNHGRSSSVDSTLFDGEDSPVELDDDEEEEEETLEQDREESDNDNFESTLRKPSKSVRFVFSRPVTVD